MVGWDGLDGWDLCVGLFYEHRFAMLIKLRCGMACCMGFAMVPMAVMVPRCCRMVGILCGMVGCVGWWCVVWPDWVRESTQSRRVQLCQPAHCPTVFYNGSTSVRNSVSSTSKIEQKVLLNYSREWWRERGEGSSRTYISVRAWRVSHLYQM